MDTRTTEKQNVDDQIAVIKAHMPEVYKSIQAEAAKRGRVVFNWVRRALRGEPNLFYAFERGHVVGTPFNDSNIMAEVAVCMVAYGRCSVCIFAKGEQSQEGSDGAD